MQLKAGTQLKVSHQFQVFYEYKDSLGARKAPTAAMIYSSLQNSVWK